MIAANIAPFLQPVHSLFVCISASGTCSDTLRVYDAGSTRHLGEVPALGHYRVLAISPSGKHMVGCTMDMMGGSVLYITDFASWTRAQVLYEGHELTSTSNVTALAYSPTDEYFMVGRDDGTIDRIIDLKWNPKAAQNEQLQELIFICPPSRFSCEGQVRINDREEVWSLSLSSDGARLAVGGRHGGVYVFDSTTFARHGFAQMPGEFPEFVHVTFSPKGECIAVVFSTYAYRDFLRTLQIHDSRTLQPCQEAKLTSPTSSIQKIAFAPDGAFLAVAALTSVHLYDPQTLTELRSFTPLRGCLDGIAFAAVTNIPYRQEHMIVETASTEIHATELAHIHDVLDEVHVNAGTTLLTTNVEEVDRDEGKELALQDSLIEAVTHEGALIQEALLHSKAETAKGILNSDGIVILRMTRMARSPLVRETLLGHAMFEECHARVRGADCEICPGFAGGAITFVPLTPEIVAEIEDLGLELRDHNIVALSSDIDLIKRVFQQIPHKVRPRIAAEESYGPVPEEVAVGEIVGCEQNTGAGIERLQEDTSPEFIIENILRTDSSLGFPVWQS